MESEPGSSSSLLQVNKRFKGHEILSLLREDAASESQLEPQINSNLRCDFYLNAPVNYLHEYEASKAFADPSKLEAIVDTLQKPFVENIAFTDSALHLIVQLSPRSQFPYRDFQRLLLQSHPDLKPCVTRSTRASVRFILSQRYGIKRTQPYSMSNDKAALKAVESKIHRRSAYRVLKRFPSLHSISKATKEELKQIDKLREAEAAAIYKLNNRSLEEPQSD